MIGKIVELTEIDSLPIEEDTTIRIKILKYDNNFMSFMFRTLEKEFHVTIERPKNKYWKNVQLRDGQKINVQISKIGKKKIKQLIRVG